MNKKEAIELIDEAITMSFKYYPDDDWQPVVSNKDAVKLYQECIGKQE